jgi:hypothetical protein
MASLGLQSIPIRYRQPVMNRWNHWELQGSVEKRWYLPFSSPNAVTWEFTCGEELLIPDWD